METVFDHNLTPDEIDELGFLASFSLSLRHGLEFPDPLTAQGYQATISAEGALFDLGLLYDFRGDAAKTEQYWSQVPELAQQYRLGFDYVIEEDAS
ncbi:hypothetical protein EXU85_20440 [Spirosoma sp. KCTC 42546]|uniref:hypothetical protein n=1 Tax=Spirosoma sp. KCTC 42546 TaxID=2520506 RepID=UPI001159A67E|nr:hypothetical protein [Spirosoma sp. KCTC 42546]QDK80849.1 hypothetical protein EXU85_20440 [Spirosoma sp. KCTC 42546]